MTYNISQIVLKFHYCFSYNVFYNIKSIFLIFSLFILFFLWHLFFKEVNFNIKYTIENYQKEKFDNFENPEFIELSLIYKIQSFNKTLIKLLLYFLITFFAIFYIRLLRLGNNINVNIIFIKLSWLPLFIKIILILFILNCLFVFLSSWNIITKLFFIELKKIHIFCHICDDVLDPYNRHNKEYYFLLEKPLNNFISFKNYLYYLYEDKKYNLLEYTFKDLKKIKKNFDIPIMITPFFYFINKYQNIFTILIKKIAKFIYNNFWLILKTIPIIIIITSFLYEYIMKKGILSNIFYILFLLFFYNLFINLLYFFDKTNVQATRYLCLCYYKKDMLLLPTSYGQRLRHFFNIRTTFQQDIYINSYLVNGLNWIETLSQVKHDFVKDKDILSETFIFINESYIIKILKNFYKNSIKWLFIKNVK